MIEEGLIAALLEALKDGGIFAVIVITFCVCILITVWREKPLVSMLVGNGYVKQKDYEVDQAVIREERASTRKKLDAVAQDVNMILGMMKEQRGNRNRNQR